MKILHIINYYHEGFGYQENFIAYYQKKLGHEVLVITSDWYFPFPEYDSTIFTRLGKRHIGSGKFVDNNVNIIRKKSFFQKIGPPGIVWFSVYKELKKFRPDIIHVHGATNLILPELFIFQKKFAYKIFIDSHQDASVQNESNNFIYQLYYSIWRFFFRILNKKKIIRQFLPITKSAKYWLTDKLDIDEQSMTILPLGVDINTMKYEAILEYNFRKKYKIQNKMVLVNAGKQYQKKRIDWIIDVAILALKSKVNIFLILVGEASISYNKLLNEKLNLLGSKNFLRLPFLKRDELKSVYCASDIGIWPGIPSNTIQEAMACKVSLILPDDDIVGHLIENNGIKESQNLDKVVSFIKSLSKDKKKLFSYKESSAKLANKYNWENITLELLKIYKNF